jgi:hypothetical protein
MNLVALQQAIGHTPAQLAAAPVATFRQFIGQVEQLQAFAKRVRDYADEVGALRYQDACQHVRRAEGRDFGIVRLDDQGETVICEQRKIVEWDQKQLADLAGKIAAAGDDPAQYLEVTYKVAESKYAAWPDVLRTQFEPARTVRPGKASFRLASLDAKESR